MSKIMIVTGASRGIGAAAARIAARDGYAVCVNAARSIAEARKIASDIVASGGKAIAVQADVSERDQVEQMFATVDRELGSVTALINNAGWAGPVCPITDIEPDMLRKIFATNVESLFWCSAAATRRMSTMRGGKGGAIVNISSVAGRMGGMVGQGHYAASKGAVDTFCINYARELGPQGIRVVGLRPGMTRTEMLEGLGGEAAIARGLPTISLGRAAVPEEIAEVAVFLCGEKASYVHGTVVDVSGGR
jgi:NAD(P)-dependent dehydrogenase (short-subunit alcohol dehydrogenase family)